MLRDEREARGMPDLEEVPPDHKAETPLELGIRMRKMTEDELSSCASTKAPSECARSLSDWTEQDDCAISLSGLTDFADETDEELMLDRYRLPHCIPEELDEQSLDAPCRSGYVEPVPVLAWLSATYEFRCGAGTSEIAFDTGFGAKQRIRNKKRKSGWSRRRQSNFWHSVRSASPERWPEYHYNNGNSYVIQSCLSED